MNRDEALLLEREAERLERLAKSQVTEQLCVLGTFDPTRLSGSDEDRAILAKLCQRLVRHERGPEAMLVDRVRIDAMARVLRRGGLSELARVRMSADPDYDDTDLQRMLDAFVLGRRAPVEARTEDELLASLEVWRWETEALAAARLTNLIEVTPTRDQIESQLALLDVTRAVRKLSDRGCVGRTNELKRLHEFARQKSNWADLHVDPAMVVHGIGGVGKSTLIARFVTELHEAGERARASGDPGKQAVWAYLDLDRPSLASGDPSIVLDDIIRQVAAQLPLYRKAFEEIRRSQQRRAVGAGLESIDADSSLLQRQSEFLKLLNSVGREQGLIVVLDTFEEIERIRDSTPSRLFELFTTIATNLEWFRLIVAGRNQAATFLAPSRRDRQLRILPLTGAQGLPLLRFLVEEEAQASAAEVVEFDDRTGLEIVDLVGGIPLTLRLAAKVLVFEGPEGLGESAGRSRAVRKIRQEFVRGFLYQRVLEHVHARDERMTSYLRALTKASLALRRVTPEILERVLRPAVGRPAPLPWSASKLIRELSGGLSLSDVEGDVLRLREDLRAPALAALALEDPELIDSVHELAIQYFEGLDDDPAMAVEAAYHRLARGDSVTEFDSLLLRKLAPAPSGLPNVAADFIDRVDHMVDGTTGGDDLALWERRTAQLADSAFRSGDFARASKLLTEREERTPGSPLYGLEYRVAEARGDRRAAQLAASKELQASELSGNAERFAAAALHLAGSLEAAGDAVAADGTLGASTDSLVLAGRHELRLELILNRLNLRERRGLEDEGTRWDLELDAREIMQYVDPRTFVSSGAFPRLLAAAFGKEEPERIRVAARLIGFGEQENPVLVGRLIDALTAWDASSPEPGKRALAVGLSPDASSSHPILSAWSTIAGLGIDAGRLLERLWPLDPPISVVEAIRSLYVWWGANGPSQSIGPPQGTFAPIIDWSRADTRELEEIIQGAYPTATEVRALAARADIDPNQLSAAGSTRRLTREVLGLAAGAGRTGHLVDAILRDRAAVAARDRIYSFLGLNAVDVIATKRDGNELTERQIDYAVDAFTRGSIAIEQMSSLAMAMTLNGLSFREVRAWCRAVIMSGERLFSDGPSRPTVAVQSTGGVGDKALLILAPLLAACGVSVPLLSGRAMAHMGGDLDKLESIPGWVANLSSERILGQLDEVGAAVFSAGVLTPADLMINVMRGVSGTAVSPALAASSVISRGAALGTPSLMVDVKVGPGGLNLTLPEARDLAHMIVALGQEFGIATRTLLSDMTSPLGRAVGNALEVSEVREVLAGGGPADVKELAVATAKDILVTVGRDNTDPLDLLTGGAAMDVWRRMIAAQGGDPDAPLPSARETEDIVSAQTGVVLRVDAHAVGIASHRLGAGRSRKEDPVQAGAGVLLRVKPGDRVVPGTPLFMICTDEPERFSAAVEALANAVVVTDDDQSSHRRSVILDRVS